MKMQFFNWLAVAGGVSLLPPATGAERHALDTEVPALSAHLPMVERVPATNRLRLAIALPFHDQAGLTTLLQQLYDRRNANFHKFLTPEQFTERFGPTEQDYQQIKDFAVANGLDVVGTFGNRAVLDVAGSVANVEKTFQIHLGLFRHPTENRLFCAPDVPPTVDASLPILYVAGLDDYQSPGPRVRKLARSDLAGRNAANGEANVGIGSGESGYFLGSDFRHAYAPEVSLQGTGQVVGLVEFDGYNASDITKYESLALLPPVSITNLLEGGVTNSVPGPNDNANLEVCLDIEMVIAMAPGISKLVVAEGGFAPGGGIYYSTVADVMNALVSPPSPDLLANQISSSWAASGSTNNNPQLLEMAAQGQTFFDASGDGGAPPGGTNSAPASFNYLTMVGGTELGMTNAGAGWQSEQVWDRQFIQGASSGYVTVGLPIPDYQQPVNMPAVGGSSLYRNSPDVAMCADNIEIVYTSVNTNGITIQTGDVVPVGGTSAAAPLWAAFTSLVNQQTAAEGKPTVGFLNPALYEIGQSPLYHECFHDITVGNNTNTNSAGLFFAAPGYDLCTGWGTPKGSGLINALADNAGPIFVEFSYTGFLQTGAYYTPFETIGQGVSAVADDGTIFIRTAGSSSETLTISKPLTITASDGPGTFGQ